MPEREPGVSSHELVANLSRTCRDCAMCHNTSCAAAAAAATTAKTTTRTMMTLPLLLLLLPPIPFRLPLLLRLLRQHVPPLPLGWCCSWRRAVTVIKLAAALAGVCMVQGCLETHEALVHAAASGRWECIDAAVLQQQGWPRR